MELVEESNLKKNSFYPVVYWGVGEKYGIASALLVLVEKYPKLGQILFPYDSTTDRQKTAQCGELAKILFAHIPEINVHLENPDGVLHYATSINMRLRRWKESVVNVILKMPQSSDWPDRDHIELLCPSFARLAPLLWMHLKTYAKFKNHEVSNSIARSNLRFCSTVTIYDPQRAAAQIAAQDAVLRQLRDPPRSCHELPPSPNSNISSRHHIHKPLMTYYSSREESISQLPPG